VAEQRYQAACPGSKSVSACTTQGSAAMFMSTRIYCASSSAMTSSKPPPAPAPARYETSGPSAPADRPNHNTRVSRINRNRSVNHQPTLNRGTKFGWVAVLMLDLFACGLRVPAFHGVAQKHSTRTARTSLRKFNFEEFRHRRRRRPGGTLPVVSAGSSSFKQRPGLAGPGRARCNRCPATPNRATADGSCWRLVWRTASPETHTPATIAPWCRRWPRRGASRRG
jgi:hypothetical protein